MSERIEREWINALVDVFTLCKLQAGETVAILSETPPCFLRPGICNEWTCRGLELVSIV